MSIIAESELLGRTSAECTARARKLWKGKRIRVACDYNGQEWGTSQPSLRGREFEVAGVSIQHGEVCVDFHISHTRGYGVLPISKIELVEPA